MGKNCAAFIVDSNDFINGNKNLLLKIISMDLKGRELILRVLELESMVFENETDPQLFQKSVDDFYNSIQLKFHGKIKHLILPSASSDRVIDAFIEKGVSVIIDNQIVSNFNDFFVKSHSKGIFVVSTRDTSESGLLQMRKYFNRSSVLIKPLEKLFKKPIRRVRPIGGFTLIFNDIEHFDLIHLYGYAKRSAFLVNLHDLKKNIDNVKKAILENSVLIWNVNTEFEIFFENIPEEMSFVKQLNSLITDFTGLRHFPSNYVISSEVSRRLKDELLQAGLDKIEISSVFDSGTEPNFRNFVLVGLNKDAPLDTLDDLGSKLESLDLEPFDFTSSVNIKTPKDSLLFQETHMKTLQLLRRFSIHISDILLLHINRNHAFEISFNNLMKIPNMIFRNCVIKICFCSENGMDGGGLRREWFSLIGDYISNPENALFLSSETNQNSIFPNKNSFINPEHLSYFQFVGRIVAKAIIENQQLNFEFTNSIYKLILRKQLSFHDLKEVDYQLYSSLVWILKNDVTGAMQENTFSVDFDVLGKHETVELKPNGLTEHLSEANKIEYVQLRALYALETSIRPQIDAFLEGFYGLIDESFLTSFRVTELRRLISGSPVIDVNDWRVNTVYDDGYNAQSQEIVWFWEALESLDQFQRRAILQFCTGSSSVPPGGFRYLSNRGESCSFKIRKCFADSSLLPMAHTCFNQLDLPVYASYAELLEKLLIISRNANTGFGFR